MDNEDVYLWPVMQAATGAELAFVCHLLTEHALGFTAPPELDSEGGRRALHDALLRAGGHALANALRRGGPGWKGVVEAVAKKAKIPADDLDPPALEQRIAARFIAQLLRARPAGERGTPPGMEPKDAAAVWALMDSEETLDESHFGLLSAFMHAERPPEDPSVLDGAIHEVVRWLAVQQAKRELFGLAVRALLAGASGGAVSVAVGAVRMAGPAYRLTIPAVTWAAIVRARVGA